MTIGIESPIAVFMSETTMDSLPRTKTFNGSRVGTSDVIEVLGCVNCTISSGAFTPASAAGALGDTAAITINVTAIDPIIPTPAHFGFGNNLRNRMGFSISQAERHAKANVTPIRTNESATPSNPIRS